MSASQPKPRRKLGSFAVLGLLLRREFMVERRTLGWAASAGFLALQQVIVLGFGFSAVGFSPTRQMLALAALWLAFLFAGTIGVARSFASEMSGGALAGLLLLPINRAQIYLAKVISGVLFLGLALLAMLVAGQLFLGLDGRVLSLPMLVLMLLASIGYLSAATLVGGITSQMRGRDAMLAIGLLPLLVPLFLVATGGSNAILGGAGFSEVTAELGLLISFAALYLGLGVALFGRAIE